MLILVFLQFSTFHSFVLSFWDVLHMAKLPWFFSLWHFFCHTLYIVKMLEFFMKKIELLNSDLVQENAKNK